jgi:hypothetical protein
MQTTTYPFRDSSLARHAVIEPLPPVSPFREKAVQPATVTINGDAPAGDTFIILAVVGALFVPALIMIETTFPRWSVTAAGVLNVN